MKGYSEVEVFSEEEKELMRCADSLIANLDEVKLSTRLRCHELVRAVGQVLELPVHDGLYYAVDHS
jgi:hypothetical protein